MGEDGWRRNLWWRWARGEEIVYSYNPVQKPKDPKTQDIYLFLFVFLRHKIPVSYEGHQKDRI